MAINVKLRPRLHEKSKQEQTSFVFADGKFNLPKTTVEQNNPRKEEILRVLKEVKEKKTRSEKIDVEDKIQEYEKELNKLMFKPLISDHLTDPNVKFYKELTNVFEQMITGSIRYSKNLAKFGLSKEDFEDITAKYRLMRKNLRSMRYIPKSEYVLKMNVIESKKRHRTILIADYLVREKIIRRRKDYNSTFLINNPRLNDAVSNYLKGMSNGEKELSWLIYCKEFWKYGPAEFGTNVQEYLDLAFRVAMCRLM